MTNNTKTIKIISRTVNYADIALLYIAWRQLQNRKRSVSRWNSSPQSGSAVWLNYGSLCLLT